MVSIVNIENSKPSFSAFRDLSIVCMTYNEIFAYLEDKIIKREKTFCVTLNLDILRLAYNDEEYYDILKSSDFLFADGAPIIWLSKLDKKTIPERTAGSDLVYDLCKLSHEKDYRIFILGAAPGVAVTAKANLEKTMPNIKITGFYSPDNAELIDGESSQNIVNMINESQPDILFVALGAPKQEKWVSQNYNKLRTSVIIPCGGSIDFIAGAQKKSPKWIGKIGLEWLYRLLSNPKRMFKRYIMQDLPFLVSLIATHIKEQILLEDTQGKSIKN